MSLVEHSASGSYQTKCQYLVTIQRQIDKQVQIASVNGLKLPIYNRKSSVDSSSVVLDQFHNGAEMKILG